MYHGLSLHVPVRLEDPPGSYIIIRVYMVYNTVVDPLGLHVNLR